MPFARSRIRLTCLLGAVPPAAATALVHDVYSPRAIPTRDGGRSQRGRIGRSYDGGFGSAVFPVLGAMGRSTHDRLSLRHYIGGAVVSVWPGDPNIGGSLPRGRGR